MKTLAALVVVVGLLMVGCGGGGSGPAGISITPPGGSLIGSYVLVSISRDDIGKMTWQGHYLEIGKTKIKADADLAIDERGLSRMYAKIASPYSLNQYLSGKYLYWSIDSSNTGGFYYSTDGLFLTTWRTTVNVTWTVIWEKASNSETVG